MNGNTTMSEPPNKKIKTGQEVVELINDCYDLKFKNIERSPEQEEFLNSGIKALREVLEHTSSDVSLGATKTSAKINWGKCLGLLLEDGPYSLNAIKVLTEKLCPGGGLL